MFRWFESQPVGRELTVGLCWFLNRRKSSMLKLSLKAVAGLVVALAAVVVLTSVRSAQARPQYMKIWLETYPDVAQKNDVKKTVSCNVCHFGAVKKNRNEYGKAIVKALEGKKNVPARNKDAIVDALKAAAKDKNSDGKTFGELLEANELPAKGK
jgi:hypothetical protein